MQRKSIGQLPKLQEHAVNKRQETMNRIHFGKKANELVQFDRKIMTKKKQLKRNQRQTFSIL